jgi:hypothetical protein
MRYLLLAAAAIAVLGLVTGDRRAWRFFQAVLVLAVLYTVLKVTGVLEALAPSRAGVSGYLFLKRLI